MDYKDEEKVVWEDRKRILGMPISFTKYKVNEDYIVITKGFFNTSIDQILLYRVLDVRMKQSLGQKIFNVGSVHVVSADQTDAHLVLENIHNPQGVMRIITKEVEREKEEKRLVGREMFGTASMGHGPGPGPDGEVDGYDGDGCMGPDHMDMD